MLNVREVGDVGCERIHKGKIVLRVKGFYFYFPKGGKGLGVEIPPALG